MKKISKVIIGVMILIISLFSLVGCGREGYEIKPNESAFLIPYNGDTKTGQATFNSEEFLNENKLATKRVIIEYDYIRGLGNVPEALLIRVNRAPVTREWTEGGATGTSNKNQGIAAESKESIGFMARFNCTALIQEKDSAKYLYRYPSNIGLDSIMDNEIRAVVEGKFVEECSNYTMDEIRSSKPLILKNVKKYVDEYFAERGITISVLGYKGELTYLDPKIQESINQKFKSSNDLVTQENVNKKVLSKAEADNKAIKMQNETIQYTIKLKELENQQKAIDRWDGKLPTYNSGTSQNNIFSIPIK